MKLHPASSAAGVGFSGSGRCITPEQAIAHQLNESGSMDSQWHLYSTPGFEGFLVERLSGECKQGRVQGIFTGVPIRL